MKDESESICGQRDCASAFASGHRRSLAFERSPICVVIGGIRSPWNLPVGVVQEVITVTRKLRTLCSVLLGCPFKCHHGRWARSVVAGVLPISRD